MGKFMVGVAATLLSGIGLKLYGKYKYNQGKRDAYEIDNVLIDAQSSTIRDLLIKVEHMEETQ